MSIDIHLLFLLIILVIVLLLKFYFDSKQNTIDYVKQNVNNNVSTCNDPNSYELYNAEFSKMVEEVQKETIRKINNAVEQGVIEGFSDSVYDSNNMNNNMNTNSNSNSNTNISNSQKMKLMNDPEMSYSDGTTNPFTKDTFESDESDESHDIVYKNDFKVKTIKGNSHKYKEMTKNKNNNDNIISYLNKGNTVKLMLFYKASCSYCSEFMPIWYKIVNNLSNNVLYEEIECEKDYKKANEYQITSVPTIILLVNNEKKVYKGDREYVDIMKFLKYNGVNLVERIFEEFDTTGYSSTIQPKNNNKSLCPIVTFDSEFDVAKDNYMFQIFNSDGQYGYSTGSNKPGIGNNNILSPFTAAYSTVDSYLTSLPTGANISECANNYANEIRGFGLCDKKQLNNILQYQENVVNGNSISRINDTDYSTNNNVIAAIKNSCGL
jgi:thiol-disulfide isomerase/thioredoxin